MEGKERMGQREGRKEGGMRERGEWEGRKEDAREGSGDGGE